MVSKLSVLMACTIFLAKSTGSSKVAWIQASQERVAATSKTLGNIKWLRLSGLNKVAFSALEALRTHELQVSKKFRLYFGASFVLSSCAEAFNPVLTFATFASIALANNDTLGVTKAFSSIFILNLLQRPLTTFIRTLPNIAGAVGSFGRIQDYLNTEERKDVRVPEHMGPEEPKRCDERLVASVVGTFQWPNEPEPLLDISKWKIRHNTVTLLLGPVGCGKSTLLKALLGELSKFRGEICTSFSRVAFCEQTPWIPNEVVRQVIVGDSEFDETWYSKVIEACDLEQDIRQWPDGAESIVGSKGISLSGGQKQRLAIARAVYSKREFLVFDDVFSGLDAATANKVFHRLLGRNGLLRNANMTVVATASDELWLKWWAEENGRAPNANLGKWLGGYTGFGFGELVSLFAGVWQLFIVVITQAGLHFHSLLTRAVSRAPMPFFSAVDSGITINRFSQDLQYIDMEFSGAVIGTARMFAVAVAQSTMLAISSKYLATTFPLIAAAFYFLQHCYLRTSRQMRLLDIEHRAPLYTQLMETLSGLPTIRAFNWETVAKERNLRILDDSQRPAYLLYCLQIWLVFVVDMIIAVLALILITITTTLREEIGPGYMGVALTNIMMFSTTMKTLVSCWVQLETSIGAVARVKSFVAEVKSEEDGSEPLIGPSDLWPNQGAIEFRNMSASYPSTGPVLEGITMTIAPGEKVGICGRTGSGKSSLALSMFHMLDVDGGSIFIDGVDILRLSPELLRSRLVAVPQEACMLNGTVRLNVDSSNSLGDDTIIHALEQVKLWPMIERRGGLDAVIDDGFFSQGQAQLLICARAMVRKSKVLVLDEATSSLDEETGSIIMDLVNTWFSGWTVVAIAHKLDTISRFDKVAVLDDGRLVEFDSPESLLGKHSLFRELHSHA
ncbi:hypothetical protein M1837_005155 [Neofusicoccum parvum]|nr:hypothetical protein M1837_005155 [Neofusicoccum parvum]